MRYLDMSKLPILGITMGDITGIGPEISVKALNNSKTYELCNPVIIGSAAMVERAIKLVNAPLKINKVEKISDSKFEYGVIDVYDIPLNPPIDNPPYGKVTEVGGRAAYEAVAKVIELALAGEVDATITGPLHKEALNLAGYNYSGHTEIYADLTNTKDYAMMLADGNLRVVHVSTHVSLREACDRVKKERVYKVIHIANDACISLGIEKPRIAVAGLNPHCGEGGLFGTEEIDEIQPAIDKAKADGLNVEGPVPPDTVFSKANGGMYDIVVVMYHDQGHIPLKVVGFVYDEAQKKWNSVSGVNITLGLPIIRVSVDHGTAFGKAGKGTATAESLENAIYYGSKMAKARMAKKA
jgi:4-hydroxythreonine-4-phosphate dehydrogenase